ncbi:MAG: hypothetical protein JO100_13025 [Pseudonocardia sp.]|nr:hypothetical protein [Pseudonocardia sp.]
MGPRHPAHYRLLAGRLHQGGSYASDGLRRATRDLAGGTATLFLSSALATDLAWAGDHEAAENALRHAHQIAEHSERAQDELGGPFTCPLDRAGSLWSDAIEQVSGLDNVPEPADGFHPHVSLAYSNTAGPAQPVADALTSYPARSAELVARSVSLINLNRDHQEYQWAEIATVTFHTAPPPTLSP